MYKKYNKRPISYYTSVYRNGGYPKYQEGDNANTLMSLLKNLGSSGGAKNLLSSVSSGSISGMGGITAGVSGFMSGLSGLTDNDPNNDGSAAGKAIGSAVDAGLGAFGIPTFGLVGKGGEFIGSQFNNERFNKNYSPSGNVIGQWKDFQEGGTSSDNNLTYDQGYYGAKAPRSGNRLYEETSSEMYMEPERREYLQSLNKEYNLPEGTLETVAFIESGRTKKRGGIRRFSPDSNAGSEAGAEGAFQFTKLTAKDYNLKDRRDFKKSAEAAAKKLSKDMEYFDGSLFKALQAYNSGRNRIRKYYKGVGKDITPETKNYPKKFNRYRDLVLGYDTKRFSEDNMPTVTAPRSTGEPAEDYPQMDKYYETRNRLPQYNQYQQINFTNPTASVLQKGGYVDPRAKIEIEGGEYVFNPEGLNDNTFKMLDNTGKSSTSKFGFLAQGKKHAEDNSAGIKVMEGDAYIASDYLGLDGKKSGKGNPSVASYMMKYGGKALGKGYDNKSDRYGINSHNPNAVKHHLKLMDKIKRKAEANKLKEKIRKGETEGMKQMKDGGITSKSAVLSPSPASYLSKIPKAYVDEKSRLEGMKQAYKNSMQRYPERDYPVYRDGGELVDESLNSMSFNDAFAKARKEGYGSFAWRNNRYNTKLSSEVTKSNTESKPKKQITYTADFPEVVVTGSRPTPNIIESQRDQMRANIPVRTELPQYPATRNTPITEGTDELYSTMSSDKDIDWTNPTAILTRQNKNKEYKKYDLDIVNRSSDSYKAAQRDESGNLLRNPDKDFVVTHMTGIVYKSDDIPARKAENEDGSIFYTGSNIWIKKDGTIIKTADEDVVVNHGGLGALPGDKDINTNSIGIEFESDSLSRKDKSKSGEYEPLTDEQLESGSKYLANWIMDKGYSYEEGVNRIFGHHEVTQYNPSGGYYDPRRVRSNPNLQRSRRNRKNFGLDRMSSFYNKSRKPDFNIKDMAQLQSKIKEKLIEAGYDIKSAPYSPYKPSTTKKKKLGGYTDYEKYYNSLPYDVKYKIATQLQSIPKGQMGGKLADMLDEIYMTDNYEFVDGREGL